MIKFINNIENLLLDLISHKKSIIFFYLDNCSISLSLFDIINNYDYDIKNNIIFINKNTFLKNNSLKFINDSLDTYIFKLYPLLKNSLNIGTYIFCKDFIQNLSSPKYFLINKTLQILDNYSFHNSQTKIILHELLCTSYKFDNTINSYKNEYKEYNENIEVIKKMTIFI